MLNEAQKQAVLTTEGPLRILAGAGTGKTRVLTERAVYLKESGRARAQDIWMLTFTHKAAAELAERLRGRDCAGILTLTFHALAARFVRPVRPGLTLLSDAEQIAILAGLLPPEEQERLEEIRAALDLLRQGAPQSRPPLEPGRLIHLAGVYRDQLRLRNAADFTELLTLFAEQLAHIPLPEPPRYLMVDEYQDVNPLQIELMHLLAAPHGNVCVVGDPDQTIYSWRGSSPHSLQDFTSLYPEAATIALELNYRNPPAVLKTAEALIRHAPGRLEKNLTAAKKADSAPRLWRARDTGETLEQVAHVLTGCFGGHRAMHEADALDSGREGALRPFSDAAILYRTQAEGRLLEAELTRRGYPVQTSAPASLWERKEVADFLETLRPFADGSPLPILSQPPFSVWLTEAIDRFLNNRRLTSDQRQRICRLLFYAAPFARLPLPEAVRGFLDMAAAPQEADNLLPADRLSLLTLHAAKGLEFPVVLIVGLTEGNLPHANAENTEEERRLLYVGLTRATEELHLFADNARPSPFLNDMDLSSIEVMDLPEETQKRLARKKIREAQLPLF